MELNTEEQHRLQVVIDDAQKKLSEKFSTSIKVKVAEHFRKFTIRCHVTGEGDIPYSLIIKQPNHWKDDKYDKNNLEVFSLAWRLHNEWVCLTFLNEVAPQIAPHLVVVNPEMGYMVLEDVSTRSMVPSLMESDKKTAKKDLISFSKLLAQLHSSGIGKDERFAEIRNSLVSNARNVPGLEQEYLNNLKEEFKSINQLLEIEYSEKFDLEMDEIIATMSDPSMHSITHRDPCPDNILFRDNGEMVIIDFETAGFGYFGADVVYGHMYFPTCWCANNIPDEIIEEMDRAYREEMGAIKPEILDDDYYRMIISSSIFWLVTRTLSFFKGPDFEDGKFVKDTMWGIASLRQRVKLRVEKIILLIKKHQYYPETLRILEKIEEKYVSKWDKIEEMPFYESFRTQ